MLGSIPMTTSQIEALLVPFPPERTWLLPAPQAVQAERGWLASEDLAKPAYFGVRDALAARRMVAVQPVKGLARQ